MLRKINHRSRRRCPTLPPKACRGLRPTGSGEVIDRIFQPGWNFHGRIGIAPTGGSAEVTECNFHGRIRVARVAGMLHKSMFTIIQKNEKHNCLKDAIDYASLTGK